MKKKIIKNLNPLLIGKKTKKLSIKKTDRSRTRNNSIAEVLSSLFDK